MNRRTLLKFACVVLSLLFAQPALAQKQRVSNSDSTAITKTIQNFWTALGAFDHEAMKQTLGWPVEIVETSTRETSNPKAVASPADFDELVKSSHRPASGRSEFEGTVPSGFSIQMLNASLANVSYRVKLPARSGQPAHVLNAVAILRKEAPHNWKIIFITVPK